MGIEVDPDTVDDAEVVTTSPPTLTQLYASERGRLLRLALLLLGDYAAAEDAVQDAFASVQRRWTRPQDPSAAQAYLAVAVANAARSVRRRRRVALRRLSPADVQISPPADAAVLLAEEHRLVVAAVRRLPTRQREVVVLRYWLQLSEAHIAAALGISHGTVKSNASRGLARIRHELETDTA